MHTQDTGVYTYHRSAVFMGVVRHEVKRSAGSLGFIGSISLEPQAASNIDSSSKPTKQLVLELLKLSELYYKKNKDHNLCKELQLTLYIHCNCEESQHTNKIALLIHWLLNV